VAKKNKEKACIEELRTENRRLRKQVAALRKENRSYARKHEELKDLLDLEDYEPGFKKVTKPCEDCGSKVFKTMDLGIKKYDICQNCGKRRKKN